MYISTDKNCPQCHLPKLKNWDELNFEEKLIVEKLPLSVEFSKEERKKHRFCTRCFFEFKDFTGNVC